MVTKIIEMNRVKADETTKAPSFVMGRIKSFGYAWAGIHKFFATEKNAQVHLAAAVVVLSASVLLGVSRMEAIVLVFSVALVWIAELFNTAIEKAMNFISVKRNPYIKTIKDVSAGAVLVAAIAAILAGAIIFIPKLFAL